MLIEKEFELTLKDIFRLHVVHLRDTWMLHAFVVAFLFGVTNLALNFVGEGSPYLYLLSLLLVLLLPLYFFVAYYVAKTVKKETVIFNHPMKFSIDEEGLKVEGYKTATAISWSDFVSYMEDKHTFYFLISSLQANLLPKRYLNETELEYLYFILNKNLKKKKNKVFRIISSIACIIFSLAVITNIYSICQSLFN